MIIVRPLIEVLGKIMKLPKNSYLDPTTLGSGVPTSTTVLYGNSEWRNIDTVQCYSTIQDEGIALPPQTIIDFQGTGVTATNGTGKTIVTIPGNIPATNYGLFAQTANSAIITNTTVETSLINGGVGSLSVPADGFKVGDSFRAVMAGILNVTNNQTIRIRVKAGSIVLLDSGVQPISNITNDVYSLNVDFTIRALGAAGVASIVSLGTFHYVKTVNGVLEGFAFNAVNNTTFDTTIPNTLDITVEWGAADLGNSIYSDIFILNKIY
jgi:hypothetical protein